tara:strand:- start:226 stop:402 length:177 start_codon:yes stop_codon:yes gene_type:complete
MNLESHLAQLQRKHYKLDEAINHEQKRPAACMVEISKLKKLKLSLKEEIVNFSKNHRH